MRFSKKVFIAVFCSTFVLGSALIWAAHNYASDKAKEEFLSRYSVLTKILGDTLSRLDLNSESHMHNAARVVAEIDAQKGLLSTDELKSLRDELNVTHIFVTNKFGKFIRSTNESPKNIPNLFSFCADYKKLVTGEGLMHATPVIQPQPEPKPYKFLSIPSHDKSRIIEVGVRVDFIAKTLAEAIGVDKNVVSMSLYDPNGVPFGRFGSEDISFPKEKTELPQDLSASFENKNNFRFFSKIASSHPSCCQCDKAGSSKGGEYYYVLEAEVSKDELIAAATTTRYAFILLAFANFVLAYFVSRFAAKTLVRKLEEAANRVKEIIEGKDIKERVKIEGKDEVAYLTKEFDHLLDVIESSQAQVIEAEKSQAKIKMAREVAHNLRSPIIAIEMMMPMMERLPSGLKKVLKTSVKDIKGLSEKLSQKTKVSDFNLAGMNPQDDMLFLPAFLDDVVSQKSVEYSDKPRVQITFENKGDIKKQFVKVDSMELRSILSNLVNNAVESYGADGGEVTVSCIEKESHCQILVKDKGAGIPEEYLNRLGKESITFKGSTGRGVGLVHANEKIVAWNGSLDISSEIGKGTTLIITLPTSIFVVEMAGERLDASV